MYSAALASLVGLMLSITLQSANALNLSCKRTSGMHDGFSTRSVFESWFPKRVNPTADEQIPTSKDTQVSFQINGAKYTLTPSKVMTGSLPEKAGYKSVTGVRYKCNATSNEVKIAFGQPGKKANTKSLTTTASTSAKTPQSKSLVRWQRKTDSYVCKFAPKFNNALREAKRRGLNCAVDESGSTQATVAGLTLTQVPVSQHSNPSICNFATYRAGLKTVWTTSKDKQVYVQEAKRRSLKCGVDSSGSTQVATATSKPAISSAELDAERRKRLQAEAELAALKAQKQEQQKTISSDTKAPLLTIDSAVTEGKQGIILGRATDNIGIAEVTIDGQLVAFDVSGNFQFNTFVPATGKEVLVEISDLAGLSNSKVVSLSRSDGVQPATLSFASLNPMGRKVASNDTAVALIVGVDAYENTPARAIYADSDARVFADYASEKLGVPENRINILVNDGAGEREMLLSVKSWLSRAVKQNQSDVYVFFAGHGLASDDGEQMYLLPYDGAPELLDDTAIARERLFTDIASANPRSVTVFLDTCYSGITRGTDMLIASRPIAIKALKQSVPDNFTVMTAAAGDQTAKPLEEAKHGMFSYFLMKGMEGEADANQDSKITAGELHSYVQTNVIQQSSGNQTPELQGDANRVLVRFQ